MKLSAAIVFAAVSGAMAASIPADKRSTLEERAPLGDDWAELMAREIAAEKRATAPASGTSTTGGYPAGGPQGNSNKAVGGTTGATGTTGTTGSKAAAGGAGAAPTAAATVPKPSGAAKACPAPRKGTAQKGAANPAGAGNTANPNGAVTGAGNSAGQKSYANSAGSTTGGSTTAGSTTGGSGAGKIGKTQGQ